MKSPLIFLLLIITFCFSCTSDILPEPAVVSCTAPVTYTTDIKDIIDRTCAYDGCHISGFSSGDFTSFEGMRNVINGGTFEQRVVEQLNMPPSYAPDDRPDALTPEELELVQCWIEGEYLEN